MVPGAEPGAPESNVIDVPGGAITLQRSGATEVEGRGDVGVRAVALLKGNRSRTEVIRGEATAPEALRQDVAPSLFAPSGVVGAGSARGSEVEELTVRHRHARWVFSAMVER